MTTTPAHAWLTCPKLNPQARLRLFCFPYAGGGASAFRTWSDDLPPDIEVCLVKLPGRESRLTEPLYMQLSPLVQTLAQVLVPSLNPPFVFFGHSMGAPISFELVHELRRQMRPGPSHLFVAARRAPHIPESKPPIHRLPESEFVEELRRLNGTPEEVLQHAELMQLMLPILQADFALCETYSYTTKEPLDCPISAFGGLQDLRVSRDDLAAWRQQTRSSFALRMLPGDHFFVHNSQAPLLSAIARDLTRLFVQ